MSWKTNKVKVVVTDYREPDLDWESQQFLKMGVDFHCVQLSNVPVQELIEHVVDADILMVTSTTINRKVIQHLKNCTLIIRHGVGYDNVDIEAASQHGIRVAYVPDYCTHEVAEQTIMLILACQRKLPLQLDLLKLSIQQQDWMYDPIHPIYSLKGKILGIVGYGRIGKTVHSVVNNFGLRGIYVYDPYIIQIKDTPEAVQLVSLERLLQEADVVTVHAPLTPKTYHLLSMPQFKMMKPTAILVNTSRGDLVDLDALDEALNKGYLAQAGIDVYPDEPPLPNLKILHNRKAICTPHIGWLSQEAMWEIRKKMVEDVIRFLRGEQPRFLVNQIPQSAEEDSRQASSNQIISQ